MLTLEAIDQAIARKTSTRFMAGPPRQQQVYRLEVSALGGILPPPQQPPQQAPPGGQPAPGAGGQPAPGGAPGGPPGGMPAGPAGGEGGPMPAQKGLTPASDQAQTALLAYMDELQQAKSLPEGSPEQEEAEQRADMLWSMIRGEQGGDEEGGNDEQAPQPGDAELKGAMCRVPGHITSFYFMDTSAGMQAAQQQSSTGEWTRYEGPHGGKGWKNSRTGRVLYSQSPTAPGHMRRQREQSASRAHSISERVLAHYNAPQEQHAPSEEELQELATHLPKLNVDQLRNTRNRLAASFGGGKRKEQMVTALRKHVADLVSNRQQGKQLFPEHPGRDAEAEQMQAKQQAASQQRKARGGAGFATGKPGSIGMVPVSQLNVDPERFQFKQGVNKEGVTDEFKGVKFNPELSGIISVWKDPQDGKDYVVNGHHRYEMAKRSGHPDIAVRYINAANAQEARAKGALMNIAGSKGTPMDAAKFMRDMNVGPEDFAKHGISLKGAVARDAIHLKNLSDPLFQKVARGQMDTERAVQIGKNLPGKHDLQNQLANYIDRREEASGREWTPKMVAEAAQEIAQSPTTEKDEGGLFGGTSETSRLEERAALKSHVRASLAQQKRDFEAVGSERRAANVAGAGNVLATEKNRELAKQHAQSAELFDRFAHVKGPVSDLINEYSEKYADANKQTRGTVANELTGKLRELLAKGPEALSAASEGAGVDGEGGAGAPGAGTPPAERRGPEGSGVGLPATGGNAAKPAVTPEPSTEATDAKQAATPAGTTPAPTSGETPKAEESFEQTPGLSDENRAIETKAHEYVRSHFDEVRNKYLQQNATPDPAGGFKSITLNTDEWRHLMPGYTGTNAAAVHEPSSYMNKKLLTEALQSQKGKGNNQFLVLAGGGGSGKGTVAKKFLHMDQTPIVLDQVSDSLPKLEAKLDEAKANGYTPAYTFVDRKPLDALNGITSRAIHLGKKGQIARTVPIEHGLKANIEARKVALELLKKRQDVEPSVIDNTAGEDGLRRMITDRGQAIAHLEGRIKEDEEAVKGGLADRIKADLHKRHEAGEISPEILKGLLGDKEFDAHQAGRKLTDTAGTGKLPVGGKSNDQAGISGSGQVPDDNSGGTAAPTANHPGQSQLPGTPAGAGVGQETQPKPAEGAGGTGAEKPVSSPVGDDGYPIHRRPVKISQPAKSAEPHASGKISAVDHSHVGEWWDSLTPEQKKVAADRVPSPGKGVRSRWHVDFQSNPAKASMSDSSKMSLIAQAYDLALENGSNAKPKESTTPEQATPAEPAQAQPAETSPVTSKEKANATETGREQGRDLGQHQGNDVQRTPTEAGGGRGDAQRGQVEGSAGGKAEGGLQEARKLLTDSRHDTAKKFLQHPNADAMLAHVPPGSSLLGAGSQAVTFKTPDGQAVRIGPGKKRADIPHLLQPTSRHEFGDYAVEKLPLVDTNVSQADVNKLYTQLQKEGYDLFDTDEGNVGRTKDGKLVVVDPDSVEPISGQKPTAPHPHAAKSYAAQLHGHWLGQQKDAAHGQHYQGALGAIQGLPPDQQDEVFRHAKDMSGGFEHRPIDTQPGTGKMPMGGQAAAANQPGVKPMSPEATRTLAQSLQSHLDDPETSISALRAKLESLRSLSKPEVFALSNHFGYTPIGSKDQVLARIQSNLEGIKMNKFRMASIMGESTDQGQLEAIKGASPKAPATGSVAASRLTPDWKAWANEYRQGGVVDKHEANLLRARYDTLSTGEKSTFADHFGIPNATSALPEVRDDLVHRKIDEMEHRGKEGLAPPIHRESKNQLFGERGVGESKDMWDTGMAGDEAGSQWEPGVIKDLLKDAPNRYSGVHPKELRTTIDKDTHYLGNMDEHQLKDPAKEAQVRVEAGMEAEKVRRLIRDRIVAAVGGNSHSEGHTGNGGAVKKAWDEGPSANPDFHKELAGHLAGMSKDELRDVRDHVDPATYKFKGKEYPNTGQVKPTPEGIAKKVGDRWGSWLRAQV